MFDFRNPDYAAVFRERSERLTWLRDNPEQVPAIRAYYRDNIAQFIDDWGVTVDPRNVKRGIPSLVPFRLFPKQREWVEWALERWRKGEPGLSEKSRDCGLSWLSVAVACSVCLHYDGVTIGFGSRKEEYVDKLGHPKSLFYKARQFMQLLPAEFRPGWDPAVHAPHMRISFPATESVITGEAGDNIGRGDRASMYFVDESAFLERPQLVDASLSATTDCRIDISSVNGPANPFAIKRHSGKVPVFTFHWRDDPRKDQAWYDRQVEILDPVTVAQEIDICYSASLEGVLIPSAWVQAAVNAHEVLGFEAVGERRAALDVADTGSDKNALVSGKGVVIDVAEEWSGKESDIFATVDRTFDTCDLYGMSGFRYDSDGMGVGVRGDARVLNQRREELKISPIEATPWRGSGAVVNPADPIPTARESDIRDTVERTNGDFFANAKAQAWWELRVRFQRTYRAVRGELEDWDPADLISLRGGYAAFAKLSTELSQVTYTKRTDGRIIVDKKPNGAASPNLADGVVIYFAPEDKSQQSAGLVLPKRLRK